MDAETKLETIRGHFEEAKSQLSIENKLARVSEYLIQSNQCYEDFTTAAENARALSGPVFLRIEQEFDEPDFFPGGGGVDAVNESKAMVFRIGPEYDHADSYFKRSPYKCIMSASLSKCLRIRGFMNPTSHEAIAFRSLQGRNIPLGVFGNLMRFNSAACQIKPFAIWFASKSRGF